MSIAQAPVLSRMRRGRGDCYKCYVSFMTLHSFCVSSVQILSFGNAAVVFVQRLLSIKLRTLVRGDLSIQIGVVPMPRTNASHWAFPIPKSSSLESQLNVDSHFN